MANPLRSWMFVPGDRERFLAKVYELVTPPDAVFFDLEDGVLPAEKDTARVRVAESLARHRDGPLRCVRINAVGTPWFDDDLSAIVGPGLDAICLPKVEQADDVERVAEFLTHARSDARIVVTIESALGLHEAYKLASSSDRVLAIMLGAEDYALDIGLAPRRESEAADLLYARSVVVNAAAAAHVLSVDGVFPDLENPDGLLADVRTARRLGFDGKATFNPRQVEVINTEFEPTPAEIEYAHEVAAAFERASARGDASVAVGGQLVDRPIVLRALRLLELAAAARRSKGGAAWEL